MYNRKRCLNVNFQQGCNSVTGVLTKTKRKPERRVKRKKEFMKHKQPQRTTQAGMIVHNYWKETCTLSGSRNRWGPSSRQPFFLYYFCGHMWFSISHVPFSGNILFWGLCLTHTFGMVEIRIPSISFILGWMSYPRYHSKGNKYSMFAWHDMPRVSPLLVWLQWSAQLFNLSAPHTCM